MFHKFTSLLKFVFCAIFQVNRAFSRYLVRRENDNDEVLMGLGTYGQVEYEPGTSKQFRWIRFDQEMGFIFIKIAQAYKPRLKAYNHQRFRRFVKSRKKNQFILLSLSLQQSTNYSVIFISIIFLIKLPKSIRTKHASKSK